MTCACCGAAEISGPFIGEVPHGQGMTGRYFQCWGDFHGKRCENTRVILAEGTLTDAEREEARKRGRERG